MAEPTTRRVSPNVVNYGRILAFPLLSLLSTLLVACPGGHARDDDDDDDVPPAFPAIKSFEADRRVILPGESAMLSYVVENATSVSIEPNLLSDTSALSGMMSTGPLDATTTFTLKAHSDAGDTDRSIVITVQTEAAVRIVSFAANPSIVEAGGSAQLSWTTEGATQVALSELGGSVLVAQAELSGSFTVAPTINTTYQLSAQRGAEKPVTMNVMVLVGNVPVIDSFTASPSQVTVDPATLSWTVRNATSVSLRAEDGSLMLDDLPLSGSQEVTPSITTQYMLLASNEVSNAVGNVTVEVLPPGSPRILMFAISPVTLATPGQVTVDWETADVDTVDLTADGVSVTTFPRTPSGTTMLNVGQTTTFELIAENGQGQTTRSIVVTVGNPDTMAPVIQHVPVTDGQMENVAIDVVATIIDVHSGVAGATLFHRTQGTTTFSGVNMAVEGNDRFRGTIAAADVDPPGVEYYILATDSAATPNAGNDPAGAPATLHRFMVSPDDQVAPVITHTPITAEHTEGQPVAFSANVTDTSGLAGVTLYYRTQGAATFTGLGMMNSAGSTFQATIASARPPAMEYYLEASDTIQPANVARSPSAAPATVNVFPVEALDLTPPALTHTPIGNGQQAGSAVTVTIDVTDATGVGAVTLYYKRSNTTTYTSATMSGAGATKVAQIPAGTVVEPRVDYYIEALDTAAPTANLARVPTSAPGTPYSFTVTPVDNAPPTISHTPISNGRPTNQSVTISAEVVDSSGVALVNLHYRRRGMGSYQSVAMAGGPTFVGTIPAGSVLDPGVEYYLEAVDAAPAVNDAFLPANAPTAVFTFDTGAGEVEPNDSSGTATPFLSGTRLINIGLGANTPATDRDYWIIDVPAGSNRYNVELEITIGGVAACSTADPILRLYGTNGTTILLTDDDDGVSACSRINPAIDVAARALAPGRYYAEVEEDGRNLTIASYELRGRMTVAVCGNSIQEAPIGEQCDDGGTTNGDGCSSTCRFEPEATFAVPGGTHNGAISPAGESDLFAITMAEGQFLTVEVSDGAGGCPGDTVIELYATDGVTLLGSDDDDGFDFCSRIDPTLDTFATNMPAGTYLLRVRGYDALDVISAYTLAVTISNSICGNNSIEGTEQCDDGDANSNDGCSSTCQFETRGTAMGSGASFNESISPVGNIDWFAVVVPAGYSIRAETFAPTDGSCATADTVVRLWQSNRTTQITSDDEGGVGSCSLLNPATNAQVRGLAAGTYYVSVEDYLSSATIPAYVLDIAITASMCGDAFIGGSETCDDGNTQSGDGCGATCQFEGAGELEPNNTTAAATVLINGGATNGTLFGALQATGDVDVYRVVVQSPAHLVAEVHGLDGGCPVDTTLRLLSSTGSQLATDTADGPGDCGRLSPGADSPLRNLAAGTYYLEVIGNGVGSTRTYQLEARLMAPGCGDLYLVAGEQCDDGNSAAGDGCSATCQFELVETESNDTATTAQSLGGVRLVSGSISPAGDDDYYLVVVGSNGSIATATSQGAPDQCTSSIDTVVTIYRPNGNTLTSDDEDGPSSCSAIYRSEADNLPAGTYRVAVRAFSSSATLNYTLTIDAQ